MNKKVLGTAVALALLGTSAQALVTSSFSSAAPAVIDYGFDPAEATTNFSIVGGTFFAASVNNVALKPAGGDGYFWSLDPSNLPVTSPGQITFDIPLTSVTFLWGSPDSFNDLVVTTTGGSNQTIDAFATGGINANSRYLTLTAAGNGDYISSLTFRSEKTGQSYAFEVDNMSMTPVPEPQTYALLLAGLGAISFVARRRRVQS